MGQKSNLKKSLKINENRNTTYQNLWDAKRAVLRGKFTAIKAFLREQEKSQINNLTLHLKQLEKEQTKPKVSRRKEIIKIKAEINEIETKETIEKINGTKRLFFEKIKLINLQPDSSNKKGRGLKAIKLEMKKEKLQLTPQKYKGP